MTTEKEVRQFHENRLNSVLGIAKEGKKYRNTVVRTLSEKRLLMYKFKGKYLNNKSCLR